MAGMKGFLHHCETKKIKWTEYKHSVHESSFSYDQASIIWDFYVTHSFAGSSGQERKLEDYGWETSNSSLSNIEKELMKAAEIEKMCCIRSTTIKDTLSACDLSGDVICIEHPRIVVQQKYSITVNENEKIKFIGSKSSEKRLQALFRHIRNAFAHANTYFFDNGNVLLEDKEGNSKITARILIKQKTLLDWIKVIDKNERFYILHDACRNCKLKEKINE